MRFLILNFHPINKPKLLIGYLDKL